MKKLNFLILAMLSFGLLSYAQENSGKGIGIGLKGSTNGYGGEISVGLSPKLVVRGSYTTFELPESLNFDLEDFAATVDMKFGGPSLLVDFYIFKRLHLTAGALLNQFNISTQLNFTENIQFGDLVLTPDDIGNLTLNITPGSPITPYVGLGFGRSLGLKNRLAFDFELGAYYLEPKGELVATGMLEQSGNPEKNAEITEYLSTYPFFPHVSVMFSYKLFKF